MCEAGWCQDAKKKALTQHEGKEKTIRQLRTRGGIRIFKNSANENPDNTTYKKGRVKVDL